MALSEGGSSIHSGNASHVHALQSKHAGLDAELRAEMARPSPDAATVQYLKKRKLALKEEIARQ
ncbi:MAG: YdcH family protein [Pseudomonadota bacterium]